MKERRWQRWKLEGTRRRGKERIRGEERKRERIMSSLRMNLVVMKRLHFFFPSSGFFLLYDFPLSPSRFRSFFFLCKIFLPVCLYMDINKKKKLLTYFYLNYDAWLSARNKKLFFPPSLSFFLSSLFFSLHIFFSTLFSLLPLFSLDYYIFLNLRTRRQQMNEMTWMNGEREGKNEWERRENGERTDVILYAHEPKRREKVSKRKRMVWPREGREIKGRIIEEWKKKRIKKKNRRERETTTSATT